MRLRRRSRSRKARSFASSSPMYTSTTPRQFFGLRRKARTRCISQLTLHGIPGAGLSWTAENPCTGTPSKRSHVCARTCTFEQSLRICFFVVRILLARRRGRALAKWISLGFGPAISRRCLVGRDRTELRSTEDCSCTAVGGKNRNFTAKVIMGVHINRLGEVW